MKVLKRIGLFLGSLVLATFVWSGVVMIFAILTATQMRPVGLPGIITSEHDGAMTFQTTSQNPGFTIAVFVTALLMYLLIALIWRRAARRRAARQLPGASPYGGVA
ncbi:hypothetical protein [Kocuria sp.]|uniref:hypothetical protein n=1 Tax=Kocuria sp. TaxID=1871328 RepID=UPI0026E0B85E|nr:hypothetical protein [Kocuria sp.]MDO5618217.1 hypothetical protein [Kocuria sp.]